MAFSWNYARRKIFKMNKAFMIILIERNWVGMYVEKIFLLLPTLEGGRGCPWHSSLLLLWLLLHSSASGFIHSKINRNAAPFSFQKFHITYKQMYKNVLVSVSWILYGDKLSLLWFFIFFLSLQNIYCVQYICIFNSHHFYLNLSDLCWFYMKRWNYSAHFIRQSFT